MSYRKIGSATLSVTSVSGSFATYPVIVRFYKVVPKRAPSGVISVEGKTEEYRLTSGAGLGRETKNYIYFPFRGETSYAEITEAAYKSLAGSTVSLVAEAKPEAEAEAEAEAVGVEAEAKPEAPKRKRRA